MYWWNKSMTEAEERIAREKDAEELARLRIDNANLRALNDKLLVQNQILKGKLYDLGKDSSTNSDDENTATNNQKTQNI